MSQSATTTTAALNAALSGLTIEEYASGGVWDSFMGCEDLERRVRLDVTDLRAALRAYWLTKMPEHEMLGELFAHYVSEELSRNPADDQLGQIQRGEMSPDDFMDANMVMDAAWRACGCSPIDFNCEEGDGMTQEQCNLWNAAYAHAFTVLEGFMT